ncbi:MAG: YchJ family protein [Gammaproteobacteria bacterium]|nr:YchJ family protein [Gammaproteobacteria bacterium]
MLNTTFNNCPCDSGSQFMDCCGQYIKDEIIAPTAEKLMRSRYSAYTLNDRHYLSSTWHATTRPARLDLNQESQSSWLGLKICNIRAGDATDSNGTVEFIARYQTEEVTKVIHEISYFVKEDERWFYVDGTLSQPTQNSPCPCGSGKKYKRCCGK